MRMLKWMSMSLLLSLPVLGLAQARYNPFAGTPTARVTDQNTRSASQPASAPMRLKAVLPMGTPPMANIDGKIVAVGEKINGYVLRSVGEQGVMLESRGRRVQLLFKSAAEEKAEREKRAAADAGGAAS